MLTLSPEFLYIRLVDIKTIRTYCIFSPMTMTMTLFSSKENERPFLAHAFFSAIHTNTPIMETHRCTWWSMRGTSSRSRLTSSPCWQTSTVPQLRVLGWRNGGTFESIQRKSRIQVMVIDKIHCVPMDPLECKKATSHASWSSHAKSFATPFSQICSDMSFTNFLLNYEYSLIFPFQKTRNSRPNPSLRIPRSKHLDLRPLHLGIFKGSMGNMPQDPTVFLEVMYLYTLPKTNMAMEHPHFQ